MSPARAEPGRLAGPQRDAPEAPRSTPSAASAGLTWSCGPTETPPEMTARRPPRARARDARRACASAVVAARARGAHDARRRRARRARRASSALESWIWPGPSGAPGSTSSSPVVRTATRGHARAAHASRGPAADGHADARRGRGACPPRRTAVPAAQVLAGGGGRCGRARRRRAASTCAVVARVTSSTCSTASAPSGSDRAGGDAHRLAVADGRAAGAPARDSPTSGQRAARPAPSARRSRPSRCWRSRARRRAATTSSASTRPSASSTRDVLGVQRRHGGQDARPRVVDREWRVRQRSPASSTPSPRPAASSTARVPEAHHAACVLAGHDDDVLATRRTSPDTPLAARRTWTTS